jgi:hypothetical protein
MARAAAEKREQESTAGPVVEVNAKTAMALNTLKVDITKILLDEIKGLSKPWAKMDEREQERIIHQCGDLAGNLVHNATTIIGTKGFPYYEIAVGKVAVDKGIEFKGTLPFDRPGRAPVPRRQAAYAR